MSNEPELIEALKTENETLRKRIAALEKESQTQTHFLKTLMNTIPVPIFYKDADGIYIGCNQSFVSFALGNGKGVEDLVGKRVFDMGYPEDLAQKYHDADTALLTTGDSQVYEAQLPHAGDGKRHDVVFYKSVFHHADSTPAGIVGAMLDVTEFNHLYDNLHQTEERYRTLFEHATVGVFRTSPDGRFLEANPALAHIIGYDSPQDVLENVTDLATQIYADPTERTKVLDSLRQGAGKTQVEALFRRRDGELFIGRMMLWAVNDDAGNMKYLEGFVEDVTERKQHEEALKRSQETARAIINASPDVMLLVDAQGTILAMNDITAQFFGKHTSDLIGYNAFDLFPPHVAQERRVHFNKVLETGHMVQFETTFDNRYLENALAPVVDDQGHVTRVSIVSRNVTERRQMERELQTLQEQIIDSQRAALRTLSSPLIPLSDTIVLMPLIGNIDSTRAQQVMETLLEGVAYYQADTAIIDVTGVSVVDTQVANALVQTTQAVQLLGAQVILTGIGPAMAQTLIHLGADLSSIRTHGNLQRAIAYAMGKGSR